MNNNIDLKLLRRLLRLLEKRNVAEFAYEDEKSRLRIVRGRPADGASEVVPASGLEDASDDELVVVTSPFAGTFHRSPSPDAPPFVEVGTAVREGQALCMVEATKRMNEVEADCAGVVDEILVENGAAVEVGRELLKLRLR